MYFDEFKQQLPDIDPDETQEWLDSFDQLVATAGESRARFLVYKLLKRARQLHVGLPPLTQTRYINTISPEQEPFFPGDEVLERRIRRLIRWNAAAMVLRANNSFTGIGGHLSTYASSASLYEVGFNHFFRGKDADGGGDQIFYQGHAAPGMYARAFLEGRLPFLGIAEVTEGVLAAVSGAPARDLADLNDADAEARRLAADLAGAAS